MIHGETGLWAGRKQDAQGDSLLATVASIVATVLLLALAVEFHFVEVQPRSRFRKFLLDMAKRVHYPLMKLLDHLLRCWTSTSLWLDRCRRKENVKKSSSVKELVEARLRAHKRWQHGLFDEWMIHKCRGTPCHVDSRHLFLFGDSTVHIYSTQTGDYLASVSCQVRPSSIVANDKWLVVSSIDQPGLRYW